MAIVNILREEKPSLIISGGASGVDSHAESIAKLIGIKTQIFHPDMNEWKYYKERNILIANACDMLYNLVIADQESYCYHHAIGGHIKSGACWTQIFAKSLGKPTKMIII